MKKMSTKKMVILAMLTAMSFVLAATIRFPLLPQAPFIKYSPSDIPIVIGGLIFGPFSAFLIALASALLEGITVGTSGIIGIIMNIVSKTSFAVIISLIYKKFATNKGLIFALIIGSIVNLISMVLLNIALTPIYTGQAVEKVIAMILPIIIPTNLIKLAINSVVSFAIFKSIFKFIKEGNYDKA